MKADQDFGAYFLKEIRSTLKTMLQNYNVCDIQTVENVA